MEWTEQQKDAIERRGSDILVSAAAGSGKTAVLTERIKRLITQDRIPIDRMLIVTFSNAAAAEMKEKIIRSLSEAVSEYEEENPERTGGQRAFKNYLKDQIRLARTADISTFHKFSMNVIRRYFYNTDIEPDFGICDEGRRQLLIAEALEELFEDRFGGKKGAGDLGGGEDAQVKEFTEFLRKYSDVKSEAAAKEMILSAYRFIMSMPDPFEWLDDAVEKLNLDTESFKQQDSYKIMRKDTINDIEQARRLCALVYDEVSGLPSIEPKAKQDLENIERIAQSVKRGEETAGLNMEFQRFAAKKDDKEDYNIIKEKVKHQRDKAKDIVKKILGEASAVSLEDEIVRINATYEPAAYLAKLVKDFHERFTAKKRERSLLDFNDIEHAALDILKDDEIAEEYRKHFDVIFIDEYQDSSILQETLIQRISLGDNVYMVGDVKQSIYKFRLAEPEIFINKYNDFKSGGRGARIDLNRNFRSKGNIISCINSIFKNIMNKDTCGIDYDEAASLKKGCAYEGELDRKVSLHLVDGSADDEAEDIDDELAELKNTQLEALVVAGLIKERIGQDIFDQKKNAVRKTEINDIVILLRSTRGKSDIYADALKNAGIPSYIDAGEGYFETTEIEVFMNLLRVIDNKRRDVPLLSVLRSPVFGFSIDELIQIRLAFRDGSYNEAFLRYAGFDLNIGAEAESSQDSDNGADDYGDPAGIEEGVQETFFAQTEENADTPYIDDGLSEKCRNVCEMLDRWRREARYMPLENFLWKLIRETGYMEYVSALKNGDVRAANLRALVDKAVDFTASHMKGLFGFITYAEAVSRNNVPIGQVMQAGSSENAVRIMTIHKSKGLEFPVVILAGLGSRFNRDRNTSRVIFHKDLGIGLRYSEPENNMYASTLTQRIIGRQRDKERIAEEMRILYVAMTRAMDELVMVGAVNNLESNLEKYEMGTKGGAHDASGFLDWIVPYFNEKIYTYSRGSLSQTIREDEKRSVNLENEIKADFPSFKDTNGILSELGRRFDFEYDYGDDVFSKSKFTVSGINRMIREAQERLVSPKQRFMVQEIDGALHGDPIKDRNTEILRGGEPVWQPEPAEEQEDYPIPEFLKEDTDITPAMRGTLTHRVIELMPFKADIAESDIEQSVRDFVQRGLLTEKEASAVNCGKVASFFGSEFGRRASRAQWLKKEWAFTLRKKRQEVAAMAENREVKEELERELPPELLIQGIIDCCFKDEKGIVLIDFKTDRVDRKNRQASIEKLRSRYRNQLALYAEVVEKALDEPVSERILFLLDSGDGVTV